MHGITVARQPHRRISSQKLDITPMSKHNNNKHNSYHMTIIHFTGCGYYYATTTGIQLSKHYKTIANLRKYAVIKK